MWAGQRIVFQEVCYCSTGIFSSLAQLSQEFQWDLLAEFFVAS